MSMNDDLIEDNPFDVARSQTFDRGEMGVQKANTGQVFNLTKKNKLLKNLKLGKSNEKVKFTDGTEQLLPSNNVSASKISMDRESMASMRSKSHNNPDTPTSS